MLSGPSSTQHARLVPEEQPTLSRRIPCASTAADTERPSVAGRVATTSAFMAGHSRSMLQQFMNFHLALRISSVRRFTQNCSCTILHPRTFQFPRACPNIRLFLALLFSLWALILTSILLLVRWMELSTQFSASQTAGPLHSFGCVSLMLSHCLNPRTRPTFLSHPKS